MQITSRDSSVEFNEILDVIFVFVADCSQLFMLHEITVVLLAVSVRAVNAEPDSSFAALKIYCTEKHDLVECKITTLHE